jgi:hypothetical protein
MDADLSAVNVYRGLDVNIRGTGVGEDGQDIDGDRHQEHLHRDNRGDQEINEDRGRADVHGREANINR